MLTIYIIRNGETEWSITGQHTGSSDIALTARGEDEAREFVRERRDLEARFRNDRIGKLYGRRESVNDAESLLQ